MPERQGRQQLEDAIRAGCQVAIGPTVHRKGLGGRPDPPLPPRPADPGLPDEFECVLVRDAEGRLTHEGAEHAIRHGGSVMIDGEVYEDAKLLPDLAEVHGRAAKGAVLALDKQIADLHARREQLALDAEAVHGPGFRGGRPAEPREPEAQPAAEAPAADEGQQEEHGRRHRRRE